MTTTAIKNIIDFAEGGAILSLVLSGERFSFFNGKNQGTCKYTLNEEDGVLQINDQHGVLFAAVENINAIQMAL